MPLVPPPVRSTALAELTTLALRWLTSFDPFDRFTARPSGR